MSLLRIESITVSPNGAGPDRGRGAPMGTGTGALHAWAFATRAVRAMFGQEGESTGENDTIAPRGFKGIGAWIMGCNMSTHHVSVSPILPGCGEQQWQGVDLPLLGYRLDRSDTIGDTRHLFSARE